MERGMRTLTSWLKKDRSRTGTWSWLRIAIPVVVLLGILFWVMRVFLNDRFWMARESANLPFAERHGGIVDRPLTVRIVIGQSGRLSIYDQALTTQALQDVLQKARVEYGMPVHIELRAEAATEWRCVEPVLRVLAALAYSRVSILTRSEDALPSFVEACVDPPPTNTQVTIVRDGKSVSVNGENRTIDELRTVVEKLASLDRNSPVGCVCASDNTVQDAVQVISICNRNLARDAVHIIADSALETRRSVQQAPGTPR